LKKEFQQDKILYLESLRGIAALIVVIHHFDVSSIFNNQFTQHGWLFVDFFFVLSGFVVAMNYQEKIKSSNQLINFQVRRFLRLYPLHLLMLFAFFAVEIAKYIVQIEFDMVATNQAFSINNFSSFLENIFLVQNLFNETLTWNLPSWSISSEFYVYLVFGFLTLSFHNKKSLLLFLFFFISMGSFIFLIENSMGTENGFFRCTYSFFLGTLIFNFYKHFNYKIPNSISYCLLLIAISLVTFSMGKDSFITVLTPIAFALLILSLVMSKANSFLKRILNNTFLIYLGTISYGVYMIHSLVWWVFSQFAKFVLKVPMHVDAEGLTSLAFENPILSNSMMVIGLLTIIGLSHLSYKLIEMPVNNYRHKLGKSVDTSNLVTAQ